MTTQELTLDSREVARMIEKEHKNLMRDEAEMQLLLGAQINIGESKDFMVTPTLDLAHASFSSAGYADVVDYFKAMTIDYYRYAKQAA